jgi:hypothetical protein
LYQKIIAPLITYSPLIPNLFVSHKLSCRLTSSFIMAYQQSYYQTTSLPITVPAKQQAYYTTTHNYGYAVSPPEIAESVTTGTGTYGNSAYSATSSSYAGSASGEYDSTSSANGVDMQEYMQDRFNGAFDPLPLDRTLAMQAQT